MEETGFAKGTVMPITFMTENGKKVRPPTTVDKAIDRIVGGLTEVERTFVRGNTSSTIHFTTGMSLRNEWGLWKETSAIKRDFQKRFRLFGHADDISGLILEGVWASVNGKDVPAALTTIAESFRKHWTKLKINPETGKGVRYWTV
jgi:hypothetical protein